MLHAAWVRHHLRPGQLWSLPRGEQLFLFASLEMELEAERERMQKGGRAHGRSH